MRWRSSSSRLIRAAYSAGVLPSTSEPPSARRWAIFGSFSTLTAAAWMRSTTACGCPPARPGHTRPCCPSAAGRLPEVRHVRQRGQALGRLDRQGAQLAGLDMGHGRGQVVELRVDLAGDHVVQRRARATVGHVHHVGIGQRLEQLAVQMADAAGAGRGVAVLARLFLSSVMNSARVLAGTEVHGQDVGHVDQIGDGGEVLDRVVGFCGLVAGLVAMVLTVATPRV